MNKGGRKLNEKTLEIENFSIYLKNEVKIVNSINLIINKGETVALVGESGSGKSITALSILQLINKNSISYSGNIIYENNNILNKNEDEMRKIRGNHISMIFQEPMTSLNPLLNIGTQIKEVFELHGESDDGYKKSEAMLRQVGIGNSRKILSRYPHQLSGGMRQRVMIAIAIACKPKLLIADEPTTALDVTIQAQILELMKEIKKNEKTSILMITHDLGVVSGFADKVAVMYYGEIIEFGCVEQILRNPRHPYTKGLIKSIPDLTTDSDKELAPIPGNVPSIGTIQSGCPFRFRCEYSMKICGLESPRNYMDKDGHITKCWLEECK